MTETTRRRSDKPRARAASTIINGAKLAGASEVVFKEDGTVIVRLTTSPPTMPADGTGNATAEEIKNWT
jgi:hypothetical protein